jgi:predicted SnoaL-like aldol condensation-catalyzing enzyme
MLNRFGISIAIVQNENLEIKMNNQQSLEFLQEYFDELFVKKNLEALHTYMDPDYFDDDIGDPQVVDHIQCSKEYLAELYKNQPTICVKVRDTVSHDDVVSAYLEWSTSENNTRRTIRKGVAIFVIKDQKILKRHTFIYFEA